MIKYCVSVSYSEHDFSEHYETSIKSAKELLQKLSEVFSGHRIGTAKPAIVEDDSHYDTVLYGMRTYNTRSLYVTTDGCGFIWVFDDEVPVGTAMNLGQS